MPRLARAVLPGVAHHLTQRAVDRRDVFFSDANREVYLQLAALSFEMFQVRALACCLMSNHVHWVVVSPSAQALSRAFGFLHGRYAQHMNTALCRSGHFWQNRFFSCALDEAHTWAAARYLERNPVRAAIRGGSRAVGVVERRSEVRWWKSAGEMDLHEWRERFTPEQWRVMLASDSLSEAEDRLRANTYTGRPAGEEDFVRQAERTLKRTLHRRKGGRPPKMVDGRVGGVCCVRRLLGDKGVGK